MIWTQWTWKPSPRSIGFDADENGQSRQVKHQIPIHLLDGLPIPVNMGILFRVEFLRTEKNLP